VHKLGYDDGRDDGRDDGFVFKFGNTDGCDEDGDDHKLCCINGCVEYDDVDGCVDGCFDD
jgi:hypothetical protein